MAFGDYATLRDDFNYFDCGVSGSNKWSPKILTSSSGVGCINNNYTGSDSAFVSGHYKTSTPAADFEAYLTFNNLAFGRTVYLFGRLHDVETTGPDGYYCYVNGEGDGTHIRIGRWDNGSGTNLADSGFLGSIANGDQLGLRIYGTKIEAYYKHSGTWTLACTTTDATYSAAGPCGIAVQGSSFNVSVDDFYMGDLPPSYQPRHGFVSLGGHGIV